MNTTTRRPTIQTTDNTLCQEYSDFAPDSPEMALLRELSDVTFPELSRHHGVIVFPQGSLADTKEDGELVHLNADGTFSTTNLMGFIGKGETTLSITSRFAEKGNDFFLHYMLGKVMSLRLFDLDHPCDYDPSLNFLIYLFPYFLRKAVAQGLFKTYVNVNHNDPDIKGPLDLKRHLRQNIPFRGNIAYSSRQRMTDNCMTQLIRHTIETIRTIPYGRPILSNEPETEKAVRLIISATPSYSRNDREKIIKQNLKPARHPYFTAYSPLQKLCLMILHNKKMHYGNGKTDTHGILFDGAWLWEEYLAKVMASNREFASYDLRHSYNHRHSGAIYLSDRFINHNNGNFSTHGCFPRYPDFHTSTTVLDAKYKPLDNKSKDIRDDCHQLITYMYVMARKRGILLFPHKNENLTHHHEYLLNGHGGSMHLIGMSIPQGCSTFKQFAAEMEKSEKALISTLLSLERSE